MKIMTHKCIIDVLKNAENISDVEVDSSSHRVDISLWYSDSNSKIRHSRITFTKDNANIDAHIIIAESVLNRHEKMYNISISECIVDQ